VLARARERRGVSHLLFGKELPSVRRIFLKAVKIFSFALDNKKPAIDFPGEFN